MKKVTTLMFACVLSAGIFSCGNDAQKEETQVIGTTPADAANTSNTANTETTQVAAKDGKFAAMAFEHEEFDFGTIKAGDKVEHIFKFKNTGEVPLVITDVNVTCGCTVPAWPKEPISPGASSEIKVNFDSSGKNGQQMKNVTILANNEMGSHVITIKGMVQGEDPTSKLMGPVKQ